MDRLRDISLYNKAIAEKNLNWKKVGKFTNLILTCARESIFRRIDLYYDIKSTVELNSTRV